VKGIDAAVGKKSAAPKVTFISGLPFGKRGEQVLASVGGAGLYFRTPGAQILGGNLPGQEWTFRVDVSDIRELHITPCQQKSGSLFGFLRGPKAADSADHRLVIKASILPGRTQDIEVQGSPDALEALVAEVTDRRSFYRDKRNNEKRWAWRD